MIRACLVAVALVFSCWLVALPAWADPCEAIPDRGVKPAWIKPGVSFSGPVVWVTDGDGLCVAVGNRPADPKTWVEVRVADYYAPELSEPGGRAAKAALESIAMGKTVTCIPRLSNSGKRFSFDRVVAACYISRRSIGDTMRGLVAEGGRGR